MTGGTDRLWESVRVVHFPVVHFWWILRGEKCMGLMEREISPRRIWDNLCYFFLHILIVIFYCYWGQCKKNHVCKKSDSPQSGRKKWPMNLRCNNEWLNMTDFKCEDLQKVRVRGSEMKWILTISGYYTAYSLYLCHRRRSEIYRLPYCLPCLPFMSKLLLSLSEVQLILESHWSRKLCKLIFKFEKRIKNWEEPKQRTKFWSRTPCFLLVVCQTNTWLWLMKIMPL